MHRTSGQDNKDYRRTMRKEKLAVVVVGEASESEDEADEEVPTVAEREIGHSEEQRSESNHSNDCPSAPISSIVANNDDRFMYTVRPQTSLHVNSSDSSSSTRNKDSLLHSLLKESNNQLKQNLISTACTPYLTYSKDIGRITRHMIATQKLLQSGCALLQKSTNDINQLNKSFITLSAIMSSNKL